MWPAAQGVHPQWRGAGSMSLAAASDGEMSRPAMDPAGVAVAIYSAARDVRALLAEVGFP